MEENAKFIFHGVRYDSVSKDFESQVTSIGINLGIKSNIGQLADTFNEITSNDYNSPVNFINAGFALREAYEQTLILLS